MSIEAEFQLRFRTMTVRIDRAEIGMKMYSRMTSVSAKPAIFPTQGSRRERYPSPRVERKAISHWIVPFEVYNQEISGWCEEYGCKIFNYTPGTLSNSDWMEDDNKNFVSTGRIFASILEAERKDEDGLNGYFLLMHVGAGPKRTDKGMGRFRELVAHLKAVGYKMVTTQDLLKDQS